MIANSGLRFIRLAWLALLIGCTANDATDLTTTTDRPNVQVSTVKLTQTVLEQTITGFGVVMPPPEQLHTLSLSYNSEIEKIRVTDGQFVKQGDVLLTVKAAEDADLQLQQAQQELTAATTEDQLVQERVRLKLATRQELVTSQLRVAQAKAMVNNLTGRGIANNQDIKADRPGLIILVGVQQGQRVIAGTPLMQWLDAAQLAVRVGIEPEDANRLSAAQEVRIMAIDQPKTEPITGRVIALTHQLDPVTRLLNIWVKPDQTQSLFINEIVQAKIIFSSKPTLVAPRQAVLPEHDGYYSLFTVAKGLAHKHLVKIGTENASQVEIIADDMNAEDEIVVLGNYELTDGMAVQVTQP